MEGSYSRVWQLCRPSPSSATSLPRPEFAFFVSTLVGTVRNEIASCDERAYTTLPLADAKTLLFFDSDVEVRAFAKEVRSSLPSPFSLPFLVFLAPPYLSSLSPSPTFFPSTKEPN